MFRYDCSNTFSIPRTAKNVHHGFAGNQEEDGCIIDRLHELERRSLQITADKKLVLQVLQ